MREERLLLQNTLDSYSIGSSTNCGYLCFICLQVKRLALENTGDVGTKFSWETKGLGDHFTILPSEGFLVGAGGVCQRWGPNSHSERARLNVHA